MFQGTRAAMEDAGCFESFFIFGRGLVRSPKCLKMNDRVEDARRQLTQLQQQRQALAGGGGNQAPPGRASGCDRPQRLRRPALRARSAAAAACSTSSAAARRRRQSSSPDADLSQHRPERPLSLGLRAAVRRLLLSDQLFDLWQPAGAGRAAMPVELRGAGRALRLSQSGPGDRAGRLAERLGLYGPAGRAEVSQGICEGLLLQAGRIQSDRDRGRQQARRGRRRGTSRAKAKRKPRKPPRPRLPRRKPHAAGRDGAQQARSRRDRKQPAGGPPLRLRRCPQRSSRLRPQPPAPPPPRSASARRRRQRRPPQGQSTVIKKAAKPPVAPSRRNNELTRSCLRAAPRARAADQRQQLLELGPMLARRSAQAEAARTAPCPWRRSPA